MKWREKVPQPDIIFPAREDEHFFSCNFFFFHPPLRRLCQEAAAAAAAVETGLRGQTAHLHT